MEPLEARIGDATLYILDLTPKEYGIPYIAGYVLDPGAGRLVVVETGPRCCVQPLLQLLEELGAERRGVDVYVTHVHLDHAGAAGLLLQRFGDTARLYAHPKGAPHLVEPKKLWKASLDFLGEIARIYMEPLPAPRGLVSETSDYEARSYNGVMVRILHTPGHASHHQSILIEAEGERLLFPGDSAGIAHPAADAVVPTSPPPFRLEMYRRSLARQMGEKPGLIAYTHMGLAQPELLERHLAQLGVWEAAAREAVEKNLGPEEMLELLRERDPETRLFLDAAASGSRLLYAAVLHSAMGFIDYMRRVVDA